MEPDGFIVYKNGGQEIRDTGRPYYNDRCKEVCKGVGE